jgi:serine O-acetyltransferase
LDPSSLPQTPSWRNSGLPSVSSKSLEQEVSSEPGHAPTDDAALVDTSTDWPPYHPPSDLAGSNPNSLRQPPPAGDRDNNPTELSLWALIREDFRTHDGDWTTPGFWAVAVHRLGNWRMRFRWKLFRAPLTLVYRVLFHLVELGGGIMLPYTVPLGRRVRIWHHGGIVIHARSIGNDVHLRHNTTLGVARTGENWDLPMIGDRVDIGCGACVLGDVHVGDDAVIGANAVVTHDVPPGGVAVGVPARVVGVRNPKDEATNGRGQNGTHANSCKS